MCISSTLRSDNTTTTTALARMPRLSAAMWNGHSAAAATFKRALRRFRSEIPPAIQKFTSIGVVITRDKVIVMSWFHAHLHIAKQAVLNFTVDHPFPQTRGEIEELYRAHFPLAEQDSDAPKSVYTTALHNDSATELAALYPDLLARYAVCPDALDILNIDYGNILLMLIDDDGTREEIEINHPRGYGTDIMLYINRRTEAFTGFETGHLLELKMNLSAAQRERLQDTTTAAFQALYAKVMYHYYALDSNDRPEEKEMAEYFRNLILLQTTAEIVILFRGRFADSGISKDNMLGVVNIIRATLAEMDAKNKCLERTRDAARGLAAHHTSDPVKNKKPPTPTTTKSDIGDPSKKPPTPCRFCKNAGKGELYHWHSLCPLRPDAGRANVAMEAAFMVEEDSSYSPSIYTEADMVDEYNQFFDAEAGVTFEPGTIGRGNVATRPYDPEVDMPFDNGAFYPFPVQAPLPGRSCPPNSPITKSDERIEPLDAGNGGFGSALPGFLPSLPERDPDPYNLARSTYVTTVKRTELVDLTEDGGGGPTEANQELFPIDDEERSAVTYFLKDLRGKRRSNIATMPSPVYSEEPPENDYSQMSEHDEYDAEVVDEAHTTPPPTVRTESVELVRDSRLRARKKSRSRRMVADPCKSE